MNIIKKIHKDMEANLSLTEGEKPLVVSAILMALEDETFRAILEKRAFSSGDNNTLSKHTYDAVLRVLEKAKLPEHEIKNILQPYSFITDHPELIKSDKFFRLVDDIGSNILPEFKNSETDIIGQFYGEFGDKKGLGIVLTPRHITELFMKLGQLTRDDIVIDSCCGTGGFLIAAMHEMISKADHDEKKIKNIKQNQLIGIEQQQGMYALVVGNMLLRGDGKANLYLGSCFGLEEMICERYKPTFAAINPPFSRKKKGSDLSEMDFAYSALSMLVEGGKLVVICPMRCALERTPLKERLLKEHTLEAVMSMPTELFYPVGVNTCIMVFTAKKPHPVDFKSWFAIWKDDGFVKTKTNGRCDLDKTWTETQKRWVKSFINREETSGISCKQIVSWEDEWCAEAYVETDYSKLTKENFEKVVKTFAIYKLGAN